jgi:hypothetical protein
MACIQYVVFGMKYENGEILRNLFELQNVCIVTLCLLALPKL